MHGSRDSNYISNHFNLLWLRYMTDHPLVFVKYKLLMEKVTISSQSVVEYHNYRMASGAFDQSKKYSYITRSIDTKTYRSIIAFSSYFSSYVRTAAV